MYDLGLDIFEGKSIDETINDAAPVLLPEGGYSGILTEVEVEEKLFNSGHNGKMAKMTFEVIDGPFSGQKVWDNIVYVHESSKNAEKYGRAHLASLLKACNSPDNNSLEKCLNVPVTFQILHDEYKEKVRPQIATGSFKPMAVNIKAAQPPQQQAAAQTTTNAPQQQTSASAVPSWAQQQ